jgi:predicted esterase
MSQERTLAATVHGRYLVQAPATTPAPMLVGFHGYAESAEIQLDRLRSIPGSEGWLLVSIQGLHRFYRGRTNDVVSSWMTRQDREVMIADNALYVTAVIEAVQREWRTSDALVVAGFSQGVAMAFRAACTTALEVKAVIAIGGDVPPEIGASDLGRLPAAFLGRGDNDEWYTSSKMRADEQRLAAAGVSVRALSTPGGHEWTPALTGAVRDFLADVQR